MSNNLLFQQPLNYVLVAGTETLAISLADAKAYLKIPSSFTQEDAIITSIIKASTTFFERITGRDLINKTYKTYLDNFPYLKEPYRLQGVTPLTLRYEDNGIIIRKSKLQSITSIQYVKDSLQVTWDSSNYYISDDSDYSAIYLVKDKNFPETDERKQAITITFVAGCGADATTIPEDIKLALLQLIAFLYDNRGDCECSGGVPVMAKSLFSSYSIIDHGL